MTYIQLTLYSIVGKKPFTEERDVFFDWQELLATEEISKMKDRMKKIGVKIEVTPSIDKLHSHNFYLFLVKWLFPNYLIEDFQNASSSNALFEVEERLNGHPDFRISNDKEMFWLEVKRGNDGIALNQLEWFSAHRENDIKLLVIKEVFAPFNISETQKQKFIQEGRDELGFIKKDNNKPETP